MMVGLAIVAGLNLLDLVTFLRVVGFLDGYGLNGAQFEYGPIGLVYSAVGVIGAVAWKAALLLLIGTCIYLLRSRRPTYAWVVIALAIAGATFGTAANLIAAHQIGLM